MKKFSFKFHWSFIVFGLILMYFGQGLIYFCYTITVILHEFGHAFIAKQLGYKLNVIKLMPYGASISGNNTLFKPKDEILIASAGPVVNLFIVLVISSIWWFYPTSYGFTEMFFSTNLSTLLFNLLPIFPLDGGRIMLGALNTKLTRKKSFKITKIVGFLLTGIIFVMFFMSFFSKLNYTLGINAIFLLIGLFDDDKTSYYINIDDLEDKNEKLKKGVFLKTVAISSNSTIYDAYKVLDKDSINQIFVMDDNNNQTAKLSESDLQKIIFSKPLDTKLKDI